MDYHIFLFSPGKKYAGMTGRARSRDEALSMLHYIDGLENVDLPTLVDYAPSSVTTSDGFRVEVSTSEGS